MLKILLVDDEGSEREGMRFLIEKYALPLEIAQAQNGRAAFEYIQKNPVDILLTDIKMPFMDGLELAEATSAYNPGIKIIIFSAYGEFEYAKKALEVNAVNYLLKPIEVEEFRKVMQEVIQTCEEDKKQIQESKQLRNARKKVLFYQLLNGGSISEEQLLQLEEYGLSLEGKYMILINVKTTNFFFDKKEELFLHLSHMYAPCKFEYINYYPHESWLLMYQSAKIKNEDLEHFAKSMVRDLEMLEKEESFYLIGENFQHCSQIAKEVELLNKLKEVLFGCESGLVFASELENLCDYGAKEIGALKKKAEDSIDAGNRQESYLYIEQLMNSLGNYKALSVVYMHYIFYDLIDKLYTSYGIHEANLIYDRIEAVVVCRNKTELSDVFAKIFREIEDLSQIHLESPAQISTKVIKIIKTEFEKELSLEYIAKQVNLVPAYLSYLFKKETGENLVKYITDFRMGKAKELLEEGNLKIVQVGKACGYENPSYFNRLFKNYYEITPKQFREKMHD